MALRFWRYDLLNGKILLVMSLLYSEDVLLSDVNVFFPVFFSIVFKKTWLQKKTVFLLGNFVVRENTGCALIFDGFLL